MASTPRRPQPSSRTCERVKTAPGVWSSSAAEWQGGCATPAVVPESLAADDGRGELCLSSVGRAAGSGWLRSS